MWCAHASSALALVSLPAALTSGDLLVIVGWTAQTFLQLVLLSVILLGDRISAAHADDRDERTFLDAEAVLHTSLEIQRTWPPRTTRSPTPLSGSASTPIPCPRCTPAWTPSPAHPRLLPR